MIITYYRNIYGSSASIKQGRNNAVLTVRIYSGEIIHKKEHKTFKGARIALGKLSDDWTFVKQTGHDRIKL